MRWSGTGYRSVGPAGFWAGPGTQRYSLITRPDEDALTERIVFLA